MSDLKLPRLNDIKLNIFSGFIKIKLKQLKCVCIYIYVAANVQSQLMYTLAS